MPKYDLDVPVVRNSSAYTTAEETRRKEDMVRLFPPSDCLHKSSSVGT